MDKSPSVRLPDRRQRDPPAWLFSSGTPPSEPMINQDLIPSFPSLGVVLFGAPAYASPHALCLRAVDFELDRI